MFQKKTMLLQEVAAPCVLIAPEELPVGEDTEVEESDTDDPDPTKAQANMCVSALVFNKKV